MNLINKLSLAVLNYSDFLLVFSKLKELIKSKNYESKELKELQRYKLERLLEQSKDNVPYWNMLITSSGIIDESISVKDALQKLPILSKEVIRENGERMWSTKHKKYIVATTGGTTGYPLTIRRDYHCQAVNKAALWRAKMSWGVEPKSKTLYLNSFGKGTFLGRLRMKIANKRLGEAFPSSNQDVELISKQMKKFNPKVLEGFATGLLETISRTKGSSVKIPIILSTGEMLYPHQRQLLENHYSGKLYTYYGCNEIGSIAFECEMQRLHICEEHVVVETVDDNGNSVSNEPGRVLVTDLDNVAMPFIRYDIGDIAVITDELCKCGRSSRVISELIGRSQDFLSGMQGQKLQATHLAAYLKDIKSTGQLQFEQTAENSINVLYNGQIDEARSELNMIIEHLTTRLGKNIKVQIQHVESISKTKRGKQSLVVRKVAT